MLFRSHRRPAEGISGNCGAFVIMVSMAFKPAFAQGAQVEHARFGLGSVLSCTEEHIVVKWDDHGEKKFVLSIILPNLKKSDRQPPSEKRRAAKKKAPAAA